MSTVTESLIKNLTEGFVTFKYTKDDGSVRTATGTLNTDLIPDNTAGDATGDLITYYDADAAEFRRFRRDRVVT